MLSHSLQAALRDQGWSPERSIVVDDWTSKLTQAGITVSPLALAIMRSFGGLTIVPVRSAADSYWPRTIRFDPIEDVMSEIDRLLFWQEQLGETLTPIGTLMPGDSILAIGSTGRVVIEYGNAIGFCGSTFEEALDTVLVFAKRKPKVQSINTIG